MPRAIARTGRIVKIAQPPDDCRRSRDAVGGQTDLPGDAKLCDDIVTVSESAIARGAAAHRNAGQARVIEPTAALALATTPQGNLCCRVRNV